jgi:hypothetical protein
VVFVWFCGVWLNTTHWSQSKLYMQGFGRNAALAELAGSIVGSVSVVPVRPSSNGHLKHASVPTYKCGFICLRWVNSSCNLVVKIVSSRKQINPHIPSPSPYIKLFCKRTIYHWHCAIWGCHSNELLSVNMMHERKFCDMSWTNELPFDSVCPDYSASIGSILYSCECYV